MVPVECKIEEMPNCVFMHGALLTTQYHFFFLVEDLRILIIDHRI